MPYTIKWLVPQQIIVVIFDKMMTIAETQEYDTRVVEMLEASQFEQVHIIADVTQVEQFPNLAQANQLKMMQHKNLGWVVGLGVKNPLVKVVGLLLSKLFGNRLQWCSTREEALAFLHRLDNTLPENIEKS